MNMIALPPTINEGYSSEMVSTNYVHSGPPLERLPSSIKVETGSAGPTRTGDNRGNNLPCKYCDRTFPTRSQLGKHIKQHTKPFRCNTPGCPKSDGFSSSRDLHRHKRAFHMERDEHKPVFTCTESDSKDCEGKTWLRPDNFRRHLHIAQGIKLNSASDLSKYKLHKVSHNSLRVTSQEPGKAPSATYGRDKESSFKYDDGVLHYGVEPLKVEPPSRPAGEDSGEETISPSLEEFDNIDIRLYIPKQDRLFFLHILLRSFSISRGYANFAEYANWQSNSAGDAGTIASRRGYSSDPSNRVRGHNDDRNNNTADNTEGTDHKPPLKRKTPDENGNEKDSQDDSKRKKNPPSKLAPFEAIDESKSLLACPYFKRNPLTHRRCGGKVLREIFRVKTHLWRNHKVPYHCPICYTEFARESERDGHLREQKCQKRPDPKRWDGVTSEQKEKLSKRVDTKLSRKEQWNDIYTTLFPGEPLPKSPYIVDGTLSQELVALQDFMADQWLSEYAAFVAYKLPAELQGNDTVLQTFSTHLFEEAVANMISQFDSKSKSEASDYNSGQSSDTGQTSPVQPSPAQISASQVAALQARLPGHPGHPGPKIMETTEETGTGTAPATADISNVMLDLGLDIEAARKQADNTTSMFTMEQLITAGVPPLEGIEYDLDANVFSTVDGINTTNMDYLVMPWV